MITKIVIKIIGACLFFYGFFGLLFSGYYSAEHVLKSDKIIGTALIISLLIGGIFLVRIKNWARILCIGTMQFFIIYLIPLLIEDIKTFPANLLTFLFLIFSIFLLLSTTKKEFTNKKL